MDFLRSTCMWLGNRFQAGEVLLIAIVPDRDDISSPSEQSPRSLVTRWIPPRLPESHPFVAVWKRGDQQEANQFPFSHIHDVDRFHTSSDPEIDNSSIDHWNVDLHLAVIKKKQAVARTGHQILKVPVTSDWPYETYYELRGCDSSHDDNKTDTNPLLPVLQKTAAELFRLTEGKKKDDELAVFRSIISSIPDPVFAKDLSLKYSLVNEAFCALLGKSQENILGKTDTDLLSEQQAEQNNVISQRVLNGETVFQDYTVDVHGSLKSLRAIHAPVRNNNGNVVGLHSVSHNITTQANRGTVEQKEAADQLAELQDKLLKITRLSTVGEIAASLAHDITQPVTAICSYASATRRILASSKQGENNSLALEYLEKIEQTSQVATSVLKGIHSYIHKTESKRLPQSLGQIVGGVLDFSNSEIQRRGVHLNRFSDGDDCTVIADQAQLIHVLMNIIKNALESFVSENIDQAIITMRTSTEQDQGVISIEDNGRGFTPEQSLLIFTPLFTTKNTGMGIGLAICKTLVEANSGSITAKGRPGQGAIFTIRLPRK